MYSEQLYVIALTLLPGITRAQAIEMYETVGAARAVFESPLPEALLPAMRQRWERALSEKEDALEKARMEMDYCEKNGVKVLTPNDEDYPHLLRQIPDFPLTLFYKGKADLNAEHLLSVVGTRKITAQGAIICERFCADLSQMIPGATVVSGLAYGVDVAAHRGCLEAGLPTVGVLAHGFNHFYPAAHRGVAERMLREGGGLLTEYISDTPAHKEHFVSRNRIIAGLSMGTVIVESAEKGGALITARLALDYNRSVFAFPGRVTDEFSAGCNRLIHRREADLVTSAADVVDLLDWKSQLPQVEEEESLSHMELSEEEELLCQCLKKYERRTGNQLAIEVNMPIHEVLALMFQLELKGLVRPLVGGNYMLLPL